MLAGEDSIGMALNRQSDGGIEKLAQYAEPVAMIFAQRFPGITLQQIGKKQVAITQARQSFVGRLLLFSVVGARNRRQPVFREIGVAAVGLAGKFIQQFAAPITAPDAIRRKKNRIL